MADSVTPQTGQDEDEARHGERSGAGRHQPPQTYVRPRSTAADRADLGRTDNTNVSIGERWLSGIAGGALVALGVWRRGRAGTALGLAGGAIAYRGVTGNCPINRAIGRNSAETHAGPNASVKHKQGIRVEHVVTVNRPAEELYRFWRNVANLPRFMDHLQLVQAFDERHSRWVAKAPAGRTVSWNAEIITEQPNELIGWRSTGGSEIANAGSVQFRPAPKGRGTEVRVELEYHAPGGPAAALLARLFRQEPGLQVRADLRRFKQIMETGEATTTKGQSGQAGAGNAGTVSAPGVYGGFVDKFPMGALFGKRLTIKAGQTHVQRYMRPVLERIERGEIAPTFRANEDDCLKVVLTP